MNKQCKFCIHSDVCAYREHYEDAVELYKNTKIECGKYPYFVCDIRCVKYLSKVEPQEKEVLEIKMTYGDIYEQFYEKFPNAEADDWRPADPMFIPQLLSPIPNAILVWLKDGSKLVFISGEAGEQE